MKPTVFISYSHLPEANKLWVARLAGRLHGDDIAVTLDQWHLVNLDQIPLFMERAVRDHDFALIVCTGRYRERSDDRLGGVGYEGDIMTAAVLNGAVRRKFIPLLREGDGPRDLPTWLSGSAFLDFRGDPYPAASYDRLLETVRGNRPSAPPIGQRR